MFDHIIGHSKAKQSAVKILESDSLAPAYLLKGPEACQIPSFMESLVKKILCHSDKSDTCECLSCVKFDSKVHPDLIILDEAKYSSEDVTRLEEFTHTKSFFNKPKVIVLHDIGNMNIKAQNKILKILESPPKNVVFFVSLLGDQPILDTINSRTVLIEFFKYSFQEFCKVAKSDGVDDSALEIYYRLFEGTSSYNKFYDLGLVRESLLFYFQNIDAPNILELMLIPPGNLIPLKKIFKDNPFNWSLKLFCSLFLDRLSVYSGNKVFYNVDLSDKILEPNLSYKVVQKFATVLRRGFKTGHYKNEWLWLQGNILDNQRL